MVWYVLDSEIVSCSKQTLANKPKRQGGGMTSKYQKSAERNDQMGDEAVNSYGQRAWFNGYCWTYVSDGLTEVGYCPKCYRYWGSPTKSETCVCGASVSLT